MLGTYKQQRAALVLMPQTVAAETKDQLTPELNFSFWFPEDEAGDGSFGAVLDPSRPRVGSGGLSASCLGTLSAEPGELPTAPALRTAGSCAPVRL